MSHIKQTPRIYNNTISQVEPVVNEDSMYTTLAKAESKLLNSRDIRNKLKSFYYSIGKIQTALAVENCGTFLMFKQYADKGKTTKLDKANFCKNPLCPLCAWRRALKYSNLTDRAIKKTKSYLYHLVLAIPNTAQISRDDIMHLKSKGVYFIKHDMHVESYISNFEITKSDKGFHPHLHIIFESDNFIAVNENYIKNMSANWKRCFNKNDLNYQGYTFYLQGVQRSDDGLAHELTKYVLKAETTICQEDIEQLALSLHGIRRMSSGGRLKNNISIAKREYTADVNAELQTLNEYDFEYLIFNYINGKFVQH